MLPAFKLTSHGTGISAVATLSTRLGSWLKLLLLRTSLSSAGIAKMPKIRKKVRNNGTSTLYRFAVLTTFISQTSNRGTTHMVSLLLRYHGQWRQILSRIGTDSQREKVKKKVKEAKRKQQKAAKKDVTWKSNSQSAIASGENLVYAATSAR